MIVNGTPKTLQEVSEGYLDNLSRLIAEPAASDRAYDLVGGLSAPVAMDLVAYQRSSRRPVASGSSAGVAAAGTADCTTGASPAGAGVGVGNGRASAGAEIGCTGSGEAAAVEAIPLPAGVGVKVGSNCAVGASAAGSGVGAGSSRLQPATNATVNSATATRHDRRRRVAVGSCVFSACNNVRFISAFNV